MSKDLTVIDQREVTFYDDQLTAVRGGDSQVYVPVTQMCRALGLDERSQRRRIQNHTILSEGYTRGDISPPPSAGGRGGGVQKVGLIRVDLVPLWLAGIEAQLSPPAHAITESQAMQISQAVKAVAIAQGRQTKRNEFGGVYGELYRKFEITSYKLLPASKFDEAMKFLTEWHISLTGDSPF